MDKLLISAEHILGKTLGLFSQNGLKLKNDSEKSFLVMAGRLLIKSCCRQDADYKDLELSKSRCTVRNA